MALQIAPLVGIGLRYGAVAVAGYAMARMAPRGRFAAPVDAAMDAVPEGVELRQEPGSLSLAGKLRRRVSVRAITPRRFAVEATVLARLRWSRAP